MATYNVTRDVRQNGRIYRKGQQIELTERQARHLRIGGFITPATAAKPADKPDTKPKAATSGKSDK